MKRVCFLFLVLCEGLLVCDVPERYFYEQWREEATESLQWLALLELQRSLAGAVRIRGQLEDESGAGLAGELRLFLADPETGLKVEKLLEVTTNGGGEFDVSLERSVLGGGVLKGQAEAEGFHGYYFYLGDASLAPAEVTVRIVMLPLDYFGGVSLGGLAPDTGNLFIQRLSSVVFAEGDELRVNGELATLGSAAGTGGLYVFDRPGGDFTTVGYLDYAIPGSGAVELSLNDARIIVRGVGNVRDVILVWFLF